MRRSPLALAVATALAFSSAAAAQEAPRSAADTRESAPSDTIPVTYTGADTRLSLGLDDDGDVLGEILAIFGKKDDSAWLFEGWLGHGGEGGLKLDYHWVWGRGQTESSATVAKVFGAVDQNPWDDRKVTLGVGFEKNDVFVDLYGSGAITDERLVGTAVDVTTRELTGTDGGRPFTQTQTTTVTTRSFEHPYDWGVGVRAGRHFDGPLVRVRGGLDYEDGDYDSSQLTVSLGVDKYFANSGHSLTLELEHYEKDGDFEIDDSDTRAWLLWRYDFGRTFRPAPGAWRDVQVPREVTVDVPGEPVVVRNEVRMDNESFFEFDAAELKPEAAAELETVIEAIRSEKRVSRVAIVGSTCDLGPADYNQALSERRAAAVRAFFESRGIETTELDVKGVGEAEPKYPNDGEPNRRKNRRVDVSFLTVEESSEPGPARTETRTELEWVKEPVEAPPAFIERALRNPAEHKRTVDVYRYEEASTATTLGPRTFVNRPPQAVNDAVAGASCAIGAIAVLANDTDPDGDTLRVISATGGAQGDTTVESNGTITWRPRAQTTVGICQVGGTDTFTYTIADPSGASSTATVTITVAAAPPSAVNDTATTQEGTPVVIAVLDNDAGPFPLTLVSVGTPVNGTAAIEGNRVRYAPRAGFTGTDTFNYTARDEQGRSVSAQVTVTVTPRTVTGNQPPVAVSDSANTVATVLTRLVPLANDSDPEGEPLTIVSITQPAEGTAEIRPNGEVVYRSRAGFCGVDTFTYTIRDTAGNTATATISINVLD